MGLEKLDTRLGFFAGRGESVKLPVCVRVRKPIEDQAQLMLKKFGISDSELLSGRFVFSLDLDIETIKILVKQDWVKKVFFRPK